MIPAFTSAVALRPSCPFHTSFTPRLSVRTTAAVLAPSRRARWYALSTPPSGQPGEESAPNDENAEENAEDTSQDASSQDASPNLNERSDDGSRDSEFNLNISEAKGTENELFSFVKQIPPPDLVKKFTQSAPPVVQNAIRETLVNMLGSLPPLAFATNVSTMSSNLVQLFHSSLVTGYMFRNATYRLELTRSLDWSGLRALPSSEDVPHIKGGVAVFKQGDGSTVEVPVEEYISELRQTVTSLQSELQRERKGGNELLSFISTMDKENIEALTKNAGEEVVDAMKRVVEVVTKSQGIMHGTESLVEASAPELGQLLFYLMVSGFFLREAEVHLDLQRKMGGDGSSLKNLLGGTDDEREAGQEAATGEN